MANLQEPRQITGFVSASGQLRPYPAYKPSGVNWLGRIPAHWKVNRLKFVAQLNPGVLSEETHPDYLISYVDITNVDSRGRIVSPQDLRFEAAPSRARRKVKSGDTILSTVRTYLKAIAFIENAADNLTVSTGFAVLRPNGECEPRFLYRLVQSHEFVEKVVAHSEGVGYPAINPSELAALPVWVPSRPEQRSIAAFLDRETAKIDALVAKKERLIGLLQEKRAALITHAVTKSLDPSAPMKDSGMEWLGKIPAHWQIKRLKFVAGLQTGLTLGKDHVGRQTEYRAYLRVANVQDGYQDLRDIAEVICPMDEIKRYELRKGDVLMTEGGDFDKLGRGYVWENQIVGCLHQNHIFAVRPNHKVLEPRYLAALMTSSHGKNYFTSTSQQTTNLATTNATKLKCFPLRVPEILVPRFPEILVGP